MITAKADNRRRVQIPNIKAGQVFSIENNGAGVIVLHELKPVELKPVEAKPVKSRLVKDKEGFTVLQSDQPIDQEALKIALSEFP
jgi:hypothetical protein